MTSYQLYRDARGTLGGGGGFCGGSAPPEPEAGDSSGIYTLAYAGVSKF